MNKSVEIETSKLISREESNKLKSSLRKLFNKKKVLKILLINPPDGDAEMFDYDVAKTKRYTNFAQESVNQMFNTTPDFGKRVSCALAKTADLISDIYWHNIILCKKGLDYTCYIDGNIVEKKISITEEDSFQNSILVKLS